jgi:hypothetical protein
MVASDRKFFINDVLKNVSLPEELRQRRRKIPKLPGPIPVVEAPPPVSHKARDRSGAPFRIIHLGCCGVQTIQGTARTHTHGGL